MKRAITIIGILLVLMLVTSGCSKDKDKDKDLDDTPAIVDEDNSSEDVEDSKKDTPSNTEATKISYVLYLQPENLPYIFGERFEISSEDERLKDKTIEEVAIEHLLSYKGGQGLVSPIPKGVKLLELKKEGKTVFINLSQEFIDNMNEDKHATEMAIASIVNTLTVLEGNENVVFKIEGEDIQKLNGVSMDKEFAYIEDYVPDK